MWKLPPREFVIEFGSHARDQKTARDIDVLYMGLTEEETIDLVRKTYPQENHLKVDMHQVEYDWGKQDYNIYIPVPCDSLNTQYKVLYYEKDVHLSEPKIIIDRIYTTIPAILREGAGIEKARERLLSKDFGGEKYWRGLKIPIEEKDGDGPLGSRSGLRNEYTNGLISLRNAVDFHFGRDNFSKLCEELWYGKLLWGLYSSSPSEKGLEEIRQRSPISASSHGGYLLINNNTKKVHTVHGGDLPGNIGFFEHLLIKEEM